GVGDLLFGLIAARREQVEIPPGIGAQCVLCRDAYIDGGERAGAIGVDRELMRYLLRAQAVAIGHRAAAIDDAVERLRQFRRGLLVRQLEELTGAEQHDRAGAIGTAGDLRSDRDGLAIVAGIARPVQRRAREGDRPFAAAL